MSAKQIKAKFRQAMQKHKLILQPGEFNFEKENFKVHVHSCENDRRELLEEYVSFLENALKNAYGKQPYIDVRTPFLEYAKHMLEVRFPDG